MSFAEATFKNNKSTIEKWLYRIMKTHFDIDKIVQNGTITNGLDYERALVADKKLRLLAKESLHFKKIRTQLRDLIVQFENVNWNDPSAIDAEKLAESEKQERLAEQERLFIETRKKTIKTKLKAAELTQENLASILGHKSKTHMSELMNGIKPFTLKDLIIMHRLLAIEMAILLPVFLSKEDQNRVKEAVLKLNKPKIALYL